LGLTIVV